MRAVVCVLIVLAAAGFLTATGYPARAQSCDDETIESVSDDGRIITTISGEKFRVSSADRSDTELWQTGDDILICDDDTEIVNKDENNERVSVRRIR